MRLLQFGDDFGNTCWLTDGMATLLTIIRLCILERYTVKACIHCTQVPETSFDLLFPEQITHGQFVLEFQKLLQCMQAL